MKGLNKELDISCFEVGRPKVNKMKDCRVIHRVRYLFTMKSQSQTLQNSPLIVLGGGGIQTLSESQIVVAATCNPST